MNSSSKATILSAGLSPAWQQIMVFREFRYAEVNRAAEVHWHAQGKVINAGIAAHHLGGPSQSPACERLPNRQRTSLRCQTVAYAGFGEEKPWLGGIGFDLAAKLGHVDAEIMRFIGAVWSPNLLEKLLVGDDFAGVPYHCCQRAEFDDRVVQ